MSRLFVRNDDNTGWSEFVSIDELKLTMLADITSGSPQDGDTIVWSNGELKWLFQTSGSSSGSSGGATTLADLTDVDVSSKSDGQALCWNQSEGKWKPVTQLAFSGLAKITVGVSEPSTPTTGDLWVDTS